MIARQNVLVGHDISSNHACPVLTDNVEAQHYMWLLTLEGALCLCPYAENGAKRVLDLGTGTGCWAIEYADAHPDSEVIGVDLSPIQPTLTPPNCSFEVDDLEKDWTWTQPFDFLFSRVMASCFEDCQVYIDKAYNALEPGGWFEMQDIVIPYRSDDGTLDPDSPLGRLGGLFRDASHALKRPMDVAVKYKGMMEKAGFTKLVEREFKWPLNTWPKDRRYKEIGAWTFQNYNLGLEGLTLALFTRALNWTREETLAYCAELRTQLRDRRVHAYLPVLVVYGQKPEK
ncbi:hypothetical protein jhhlp_005393 [Lomentospora prolificans]|uniref:Methyltransferase domain-containing protein n=1 Tax=Lomentospora prolificans TaxID=41688 RepID=A0A2N3N6R1_9PEZI|nr:hypothetical protein jhhlp_005393 [Lomentospora prolificans]